MKFSPFVLIGLFLTSLAGAAETVPAASAPAPAPASRPVAAIERALVISCDGMRPDVLLRADAPSIRALMARGSFSLWAHTVPVAITLPSHTSMLTGVYPEKHGITWNDSQPAMGFPKVPTLFELAKKAGYTTGMVSGKVKFETLAKPGTVDWKKIDVLKDAQVADAACEMIEAHQPQVMFIHFPGADTAGHAIGWGTPQQVEAVNGIDKAIGRVIKTLDKEHLLGSTVIILSADHGGAGRKHGGLDPRSQHIPWICAGPGIRTNVDLTENPSLEISTVDTFATICFLMAIPPGDVDGRPIKAVLAERELMEPMTKPSVTSK